MTAHDPKKYAPLPAIENPTRAWPGQTITRAPIWCSVDLRDGNQSLPNPLSPEAKLEYFQLLCEIGFKYIEVAFPSASKDDFDFTRRLIEKGHIPDDVFIMGLVQCREHLIDRTFDAFADAPRAVVHAYAATSDLHMKQVFQLSREETIAMAVRATKQIRARAEAMPDSDIRYEFSPEEFSDTDLNFAIEICEAVTEAWGRATPEKPIILNLPATVERRPPNHYADMIEVFGQRFSQRDNALLSLHAHNDQGMAVAASEMGLLAGGDRVEGTLFGHGERTGNVDIVTIANNLTSRGIETGLDFSHLDRIIETVERLTGMGVYYRQPYAGELVFTAFSGSHQDAIRKGMAIRDTALERFGMGWKVPYLHIDPADVGREYEDLIRINSQSGKGGVAWVLEQEQQLHIPKAMQPELGRAVQACSDATGRELNTAEVLAIFQQEFLNPQGPYELLGYWPRPDNENPTWIHGEAQLRVNGEETTVQADGNGPIDAFMNAMQKAGAAACKIQDYHEDTMGKGSDAQAASYVSLVFEEKDEATSPETQKQTQKPLFGVGVDTNIDQAAVRAIVAAMNRHAKINA